MWWAMAVVQCVLIYAAVQCVSLCVCVCVCACVCVCVLIFAVVQCVFRLRLDAAGVQAVFLCLLFLQVYWSTW